MPVNASLSHMFRIAQLIPIALLTADGFLRSLHTLRTACAFSFAEYTFPGCLRTCVVVFSCVVIAKSSKYLLFLSFHLHFNLTAFRMYDDALLPHASHHVELTLRFTTYRQLLHVLFHTPFDRRLHLLRGS